MTDVKNFYTTRNQGQMTTQSRFYTEGMLKEEIIEDFKARRKKLTEYSSGSIAWNRMYVLTQDPKLEKHASGDFVDLSEYLKYQIAADSEVDFWFLPDTYGDIAYLDKNTKGIILGYPTADCPVIQMYTTEGEIALAHCGGPEINRGLPNIAVDSFLTHTGARSSKAGVLVGPFAQPGSYTYDTYPKWATDKKIWNGCITEKDGLYYIDMRKALSNQLPRAVKNVRISQDDTVTDSRYYSNNASGRSVNPDPTKAGRHFVGIYVPGEPISADLTKRYNYSLNKSRR